jgi:hypothetical protein
MGPYRDSASFGKRQEYSAVAELLKRGFDVYMTLVDDKGIDCVVRLDQRRYVDVQIKARSKTAKQWNFFAAMAFRPRRNLYFIFYTEKTDSFWVMPSYDVARLSARNRGGRNAGKYALSLPKDMDGAKAKRLSRYLNDRGFRLLRGSPPAPAGGLRRAK